MIEKKPDGIPIPELEPRGNVFRAFDRAAQSIIITCETVIPKSRKTPSRCVEERLSRSSCVLTSFPSLPLRSLLLHYCFKIRNE